MQNSHLLFVVIACILAQKTAAEADASPPAFLRGDRRLVNCRDLDITECKEERYENTCKVLRRDGKKNLCVEDDMYEPCRVFDDEEEDCWEHYPQCVYEHNNRCMDRASIRRNARWCDNDNDCRRDEICAPSRCLAIFDPCLDQNEGQCIPKPNQCPSSDSNDRVCGCNGKTYDNACQALKDDVLIHYEDSCSDRHEEDFEDRKEDYVRDYYIDDGICTDDYYWDYVRDSVRTNGEYCLQMTECKEQSMEFDGRRNFRVVSDPYNCGCYHKGNVAYWSNHRNCSTQKMRAESLQNDLVRTHCDLYRIYRDMRNVRAETCLSIEECDDQCYREDGDGVREKTDRDSDLCGCYRRGNRYFWNDCGNNRKKAVEDLTGNNERVWCYNRDRDVRDIADETCLTRDECEEQGDINGDVRLPAIVKDFTSESNCGCYSKGGSLYWARCDNNGDFYGDLNNQKVRIHCTDLASRSYRVFNRQYHSHAHSHPHDIEDHVSYYYYYDDEDEPV